MNFGLGFLIIIIVALMLVVFNKVKQKAIRVTACIIIGLSIIFSCVSPFVAFGNNKYRHFIAMTFGDFVISHPYIWGDSELTIPLPPKTIYMGRASQTRVAYDTKTSEEGIIIFYKNPADKDTFSIASEEDMDSLDNGGLKRETIFYFQYSGANFRGIIKIFEDYNNRRLVVNWLDYVES